MPSLKFVPRGKTAIGDAVVAFGLNKNLLPTDRNVSFFFDYKTGTCDINVITELGL